MRVGLYAHQRNLEVGAFCSGLLNLGHKPVWRNASDYGERQTERFDCVVLSGTRAKGAWIARDYKAQGVPVVVMDYGYLNRVSGMATWETGYWQVGVGGLNRPPAFQCPDDRLKALGVTPKRKARNDGPVLVLGQHSGDPSHGMSDREMKAWAQEKCDKYGAHFRPHPDSPSLTVDAPQAAGDYQEWLGKASRVHTICSTGGLEALLAGVPAVAEKPERACWGDLSGFDHPGSPEVRKLCQRLSYGQWTLDEMRDGSCVGFVLDNLERWSDGC